MCEPMISCPSLWQGLENEMRALQTRLNSVLYHTYVVEAKNSKKAQSHGGEPSVAKQTQAKGGWAGVRRLQGQATHCVGAAHSPP